jgi:hypothetical protein
VCKKMCRSSSNNQKAKVTYGFIFHLWPLWVYNVSNKVDGTMQVNKAIHEDGYDKVKYKQQSMSITYY